MIIHTFDEHLDADEPWHTVNNLYGHGGAYSNILSCSIINDRKAGRFNGAGGVILSPASRTLCSYPYDGGAMEFEWGCQPEVCWSPTTSGTAPSAVDALPHDADTREWQPMAVQ